MQLYSEIKVVCDIWRYIKICVIYCFDLKKNCMKIDVSIEISIMYFIDIIRMYVICCFVMECIFDGVYVQYLFEFVFWQFGYKFVFFFF